MGEIKPQDAGSGLVERSWVRTSRKAGVATERTLEGEHVEAAWVDREGQLRRIAGIDAHGAHHRPTRRGGVGASVTREGGSRGPRRGKCSLRMFL